MEYIIIRVYTYIISLMYYVEIELEGVFVCVCVCYLSGCDLAVHCIWGIFFRHNTMCVYTTPLKQAVVNVEKGGRGGGGGGGVEKWLIR